MTAIMYLVSMNTLYDQHNLCHSHCRTLSSIFPSYPGRVFHCHNSKTDEFYEYDTVFYCTVCMDALGLQIQDAMPSLLESLLLHRYVFFSIDWLFN
jgi:hypothetical protein